MSAPNVVLNFNVGVLGHVDSGKTSLAKALSTVASTASFDKNPQSRERGITLDLGFSSFTVDAPDHIRNGKNFEKLQFTLVDCPGHASLIRTIIGGAQIVDMMLLVVDITKGMQTQTAECLIVGEITCNKMLVVLNKLDLVPQEKRGTTVDKMKKRLWKTLENTKFAGCNIVAVAAKPGGNEGQDNAESIGISDLIETLKTNSFRPVRKAEGPLLFSIDHCFLIKGQGTVMTGTMLSGSIAVNDVVEISSLKVTKKVKSMQMFRTTVNAAKQGDRIGICVTQFDPKLLERGLVCKPGSLTMSKRIITTARKIPYFKGKVQSKKGKFHIIIGHETTMGMCTFFESRDDDELGDANLYGTELASTKSDGGKPTTFDFSKDYIYRDDLPEDGAPKGDDSSGTSAGASCMDSKRRCYAVIDLDHSIDCCSNFLVIASKLDTDIHANSCRLAFHGRIAGTISDQNPASNLKIFKTKTKEGVVERKLDEYTVICKNLFRKETNIDVLVGLKVKLSSGESGAIEGMFGQSGKTKIRLPGGLFESTSKLLAGKGKRSGKAANQKSLKPSDCLETSDLNDAPDQIREDAISVLLEYKRYIFDSKKKIIQI